jgi:hypothetical protein
MQTLVRKAKWRLHRITAPKKNAGGHQSICNKCRFAKDNHFALQIHRNISIFI